MTPEDFKRRHIIFVPYVYNFYGKNGLYDMGATIEQIAEATQILIDENKIVDFGRGDRIKVRNLLVIKFGLVSKE